MLILATENIAKMNTQNIMIISSIIIRSHKE